MQKLKILLQSKWFYFILIALLGIRIFTFVNFPKQSVFNLSDTSFVGTIQDIEIGEEDISVTLKVKNEVLSGKIDSSFDISKFGLNDLVEIKGTLKEIAPASVFYLFDYKKYAARHDQYYSLKIENIELIEENKNILYKFKNFLIDKIENYDNKDYLYAFILGNTSYIDEEVMNSYRDNGVSHLLAVSGMHISFLMGIIYYLFDKFKFRNVVKLSLAVTFLFVYSFLVGFTPSVLRSSIFFVLLKFNKIFDLEISVKKVFFIVFFLVVFLNPNYLFETGFQYSFLISFVLILFSNYLQEEKNYFLKLLKVSFIASVVSLPITVYYFHQINILGILYNLVFVPFVSFLIFPLSFALLFVKPLSFVYSFLIDILESISMWFDTLVLGKLIMRHPDNMLFVFIILFVLLCLLLIYKHKKISILVFIFGVYLYSNINYFINEDYMIMLDVSQGDSLFLYSDNQNMLIDTGGAFSYNIAENTIIPYLKAKGVKKIDTLVLTHGDYDHMGEAINLVNNFKVEKVIFNNDDFNDLELKLIKVLNKENIKYYKNVKELSIYNNKVYFLNNKLYDNENDNSNVIYTEFNGIKLLLMGDAGVEVEEDILKKYNLKDIDILKVGHHGSSTSSSKKFINEINPKYSLISVGKNNRYNHPNKEVLENLEGSTIYRADLDGSVMFKIKKNKLEIETCTP